MINLMIRIYRANPLRPHCNGAAGRHVWLCRVTAFIRGGRQDCPEGS